jgi:replicative DNA helicase
MIYKRFARGEGSNIYDHVIYPENFNLEEVIKRAGPSKPYYLSLFNYNKEHHDRFTKALKTACKRYEIEYDELDLLNIRSKINLAITKEKRRPGKEREEAESLSKELSFAGLDGLKTNRLVFDFDSHDNKDIAKDDTIELINRLVKHNIEEDAIQVCFSGNKGFSVEVSLKEEVSKDEFINIVDNLAGDLKTFDGRIRDYQRVFRVPLTRHGVTGLYKTPLYIADLKEMTIAQIQGVAKVVDDQSKEITSIWKPSDLQDLLKYKDIPKKVDDLPDLSESCPGLYEGLDLDKKPNWLTPEKYALQEGFFGFEQGERNDGFMILGATYRNQGFNKEIALRMLQGVADLQSKRSGRERFSDKEIEANVINMVYSPTWRGGMYTIKHNQLLQRTAERFGFKPTEEAVDPNFENIDKMVDDFFNYAKSFSQNVIKTGITSFDNSVLLTTGQMISLVGSPGSGKCLKKGTPVYMFDKSVKNVEDIKIGDLLMGPDFKSRKVLALGNGFDQLYSITPHDDGLFWSCNSCHLLYLYNKNTGKNETMEARDYYNLNNKNNYLMLRAEDEIVYETFEFTIGLDVYGEYFGFEIDGDKLFLLGDFTVTHNTSWANAFVENVSQGGGKVLYFSMDMSKQLLIARIMQRHCGIDYREILDKIERNIPTHEIQVARDKVRDIYKNVRIDARSGLSIEEIQMTVENYQRMFDGGLKLVVIDYLEKISGVHSENSVSSTANIVAKLGNIAKDKNVALLLLVQPQKSAGNVWDELTMRSIKGTSVIEQDSRIIMGLSRPGSRLQDRVKGKDIYAFVDILKQNMGETGRHSFKWDGKAGQLIEMTDEDARQLDELLNEIEIRESTKMSKGFGRKTN